MSKSNYLLGHIYALITVFIWGVTFISTKLLLVSFSPIEIMIYRFVIAWAVLSLFDIKTKSRPIVFKQELLFAGAGLTGVCAYFLLENIALIYTSASNVGVIAATAPFFTGFFAFIFLKDDVFSRRYTIGFMISLIGVCLISFGNQSGFQFSLKGDLIALIACISWGIYAILSQKIADLNVSVITATKKIFFYGLIGMFIVARFMGFDLNWSLVLVPLNLTNLLFLGLGASALCFLLWNKSVALIGPIKTSAYIYVMPVFTIITSAIILDEPISVALVIGSSLAIFGLLVSEGILINKSKKTDKN